MMDRMNWGPNPEYGDNAMVAHFDADDQHCWDFQEMAREMGKTISVMQCNGRDGLTIIIPEISFQEMNALVNASKF